MKETMKDVDKALKEEEKREERLAREISHTLKSRDHNEVADEVDEDIMASELIADGEGLKDAMKQMKRTKKTLSKKLLRKKIGQ